MKKPVEAIKARADMLDWFGEITNDDTYVDRAKTLRIDMQISREKGTIDDSRIYVDPLKYTQWINDNIINELTLLLDGFASPNQTSFNWEESSTGITKLDLIMAKLLECYDEFCKNNMFGIASYLGRRIRHGTFEGTGLTEVKALAAKEEYGHLFDDTDFKTYFDTWMDNYCGMIDDLVKSYLHIRTKKKTQGYITTAIDSKRKSQYASQMILDIVSSYDKYHAMTEVPYVITEYCWRLVEVDLDKIRKLLMENKSNYAVFKYRAKNHFGPLRYDISKFTQEINTITAEKFRTISSWFNKPTYASPSTDLYVLFRAVVSEVKESFNTFEPEINTPDQQCTIAGGMYFVIYDALYVLIYNAAKHGKERGNLAFQVDLLKESDALRLTVTSEVTDSGSYGIAVENINKYMEIFSDDANVIEGKSGIKKLKRLEREGSISDLCFNGDLEKLSLTFSFNFLLTARSE